MCHKCHKYFVVEMEVGISKKTIVWFLLSQQTLAKKKIHWCFSFQLRKSIYKFPLNNFQI